MQWLNQLDWLNDVEVNSSTIHLPDFQSSFSEDFRIEIKFGVWDTQQESRWEVLWHWLKMSINFQIQLTHIKWKLVVLFNQDSKLFELYKTIQVIKLYLRDVWGLGSYEMVANLWHPHPKPKKSQLLAKNTLLDSMVGSSLQMKSRVNYQNHLSWSTWLVSDPRHLLASYYRSWSKLDSCLFARCLKSLHLVYTNAFQTNMACAGVIKLNFCLNMCFATHPPILYDYWILMAEE